jgi:hypothetical protein
MQCNFKFRWAPSHIAIARMMDDGIGVLCIAMDDPYILNFEHPGHACTYKNFSNRIFATHCCNKLVSIIQCRRELS